MIELTVSSEKAFLGILVTTDFYEAARRPDMSLGHWWINDSMWFKAVEDTPDPCGITHKKWEVLYILVRLNLITIKLLTFSSIPKSGSHKFYFKPTGPLDKLRKKGFRVVMVMSPRSTSYQFHVDIRDNSKNPTKSKYENLSRTVFPCFTTTTGPCNINGKDTSWQKGGNKDCCRDGEHGPCGEGEGDCDSDSECAGPLVCGKDNCPWGDEDDCCTNATTSCKMEPTIVSDPLRYNNNFKAEHALSNTDKNGQANWLSKDSSTGYFVYDLGCKTSISTLALRRGNNWPYRDR